MRSAFFKIALITAGMCLAAGCQDRSSPYSSNSQPEWAETLDLCQLAAWQRETYPALFLACSGHSDADSELISKLSARSLCAAGDSVESCLADLRTSEGRTASSRAHKMAYAIGDDLKAFLPEREISPYDRDRTEGWKKELDENDHLTDEYAGRIRTQFWNAQIPEKIAYHAFTAKQSDEPDHRLASQITVATLVADFGFFDEAAAHLDKVDDEDLARVLQPDWTLYTDKVADFTAADQPHRNLSVISRYRDTVGAIFATQLGLGNERAARRTLDRSRPMLMQPGVGGASLIDLMETLLGKPVEKETLFDKIYLNDNKVLRHRYRRGLSGWYALTNEAALAFPLHQYISDYHPEFIDGLYKPDPIWAQSPNMSDADFLDRSPGLRLEMARSRTRLHDRITKRNDAPEDNNVKIKPPEHVDFARRDIEATPPDETLLSRIQSAGIGQYGVAAARERADGEVQIIYQSGAIDPSGETGIGGYWLLQGNPEKGEWLDPLYLGLRTLMPYTIDGFASLEVQDQTGSEADILHLSGAQQALDLGSVSFPPISMQTDDPERGVLTIDLNRVRADSDRDALTDLYETRIGLDPNNRDTDQDGISDGRDSVPTRAYVGTDRDRKRAYALMSILEHHEEGALIQVPQEPDDPGLNLTQGLQLAQDMASDYAIYSDPIPRVHYLQSDFEGLGKLVLPYRLIVQDAAEAEKMEQRFKPHYPVRFRQFYQDPYADRMIVIWDAGWVGGTILLTRQADGSFARKTLSSWIT